MAAEESAPEFCLKWNNYQESLATAFSGFLEREDFLDVSLACDDAVIGAHKCILSACSPFFQEILLKNPCSHPTVVLPAGVKASHVSRLVSFVYHGEVSVPHQQLSELIRTADLLRIRGLTSESVYPLELTSQPLEVQAVMTVTERGPPDISAPSAAPCSRRKRRRDTASSPPPPELVAAVAEMGAAPPPALGRAAAEPAALLPSAAQGQRPGVPELPPSAGVDSELSVKREPGTAEPPAPDAPPPHPRHSHPREPLPPEPHPREPHARHPHLMELGAREPHPGAPPQPGEQQPSERCRSPQLGQLQVLDGLDMLDPTQLLGFDGSAGGPSTHRPCPVCNRIMRKRDISRHMQRVHSERKHSCDHCPLSYGYRLDLRRHLLEKHAALAGRDSPLSAGSAHQPDCSDSEEGSDE